ncbi:hypothetical protein BGX20_002074, partial [Mortierella sp. AD010]
PFFNIISNEDDNHEYDEESMENDSNDESSIDDAAAQNGTMLFKSPFGKKNGATIPERWQGVVNVLFEGGEQLTIIGGENVYENVALRTCWLAWGRFKSGHHKHAQAQIRLTGAVENEDSWTNLVRIVAEVEEVELDKKSEAAESHKQSTELMEQSNREGALLVEASLARMCRGSKMTTDGSAAEDSGASAAYFPRSKRSQHRELQKQMSQRASLFIDNTQQIIATSSQNQQDNHNELMQRQQDNHSELMQGQKELMRTFQHQMNIGFSQLAQAQAEASDRKVAVSDRQTAAFEALASALLTKK